VANPVDPKKLLSDFVAKVGSQTAAARFLGCSKQQITHLLSGTRRFDRVKRPLARALYEIVGIPGEAMDWNPVKEPTETDDAPVGDADEYDITIRISIARRR
jgi:hypothetical protein